MVYKIEPLNLNALLVPLTTATAAVTRLDERLARSPVRDGFIERQHFADACAALWLEGELVHAEDLVLHDAHMDIRTPTHELTRAHGVLRARRQLFGHKPDWALSGQGLRTLTGRGGAMEVADGQGASVDAVAAKPETLDDGGNDAQASLQASLQTASPTGTPLSPVSQTTAPQTPVPDELTKALEAMDAALARSVKVLDGQRAQAGPEMRQAPERPSLVYDPDRDEDARLDEWQEVIAATRSLPPVLRAALLIEAWAEIDVLQHASWLGPLLTAALLRQDGLTSHHLPSLHFGLKQIPREKRRARERTGRLLATLDAIHQAANLGLKEHDRLSLVD